MIGLLTVSFFSIRVLNILFWQRGSLEKKRRKIPMHCLKLSLYNQTTFLIIWCVKLIEYAANLGDVLKEFTKYFGQYVPDHVGREKTDLEKKAMVRSLSLSDSEDPNRIYCMCVKRNADGKKRSKYNSNKTRILRNALYEIFKDDETISFCFSSNPEDERSDKEILERLAKRNSI